MERKKQWLARLKNEISNSPLVSNVAFGFILMGLEKLVELEFECPCNPKWNGLFSSAFFIVPAIMAFILMLIIQGRRHKELILKFIAQGCKCDEFFFKLDDKRCSCDEKTLKLINQKCSCDKSQFTLNTQEGKCDEFILKSITGRCSCDKSTLKLITKGCSCDESTLKLITKGCSCDESTVTLITQGCRCGKSKFTQKVKRDEWLKKTVSTFVPAIVWLILLFFDGQYFACAKTDWEGRFVLVDKAAPQKWCEPISEGNFTRQELMLRSQEWIVMSQVIAILLLIFICMGLTVYLIRNSCQEKKQTDPTEVMQLSEVRSGRFDKTFSPKAARAFSCSF
ncbi:uncharacterized protein LOC130521725 isoform X1 [Takifugu flavidus]|uniref:Transmembrane protein n=1 Tax=Takifugu flavidus TaxID=433684 RepID=A0A5C6NLF3_9TELE|nr:uncharacterized protein LOC130521725 isoform X1 [Takifugu flavidus]XP_056881446.1 uncharacterized protein LOC130521725 isoform X1 [Takifugu flavidus]XP_056881448.1 uncharacterized protein LOC130521725 isoform X1 [Takifugu flavidus]XP_056881449.1 uncharacterized protein LOC130521725 isoform X1 [Takifugu flavidus]XP_056881450.1 uncharacterized protein LOC130521725 isoform X1 [Takifugu flavidus]XP_056881451.1 uncharacterized protein LOC130521725 isoform X1 [Takifugu flavidus]TWW67481.1 hypoth